MNSNLQNLPQPCKKGVAGIGKIYFFFPDRAVVETQPCNPVINPPAMIEDEVQYEIEFNRFTAVYEEELAVGDRAGDYYKYSLTFNLRRDFLNTAQTIEAFKNKRMHVIYESRDGGVKFVPNIRASVKYSNGPKLNGQNGYIFTMSGKSVKKNPFISGYAPTLTDSLVSEGVGLFLIASDGSKWKLGVTDYGAIITTLVS
jgi:hypothetical protein